MNNEQIGVPSISSTSAATGGALSSQEQLLKAISIGHDAGINNATNDDEDANIATLNSNKIQAVVPDTPIVSIAGGTLSESTSTTTSTKTTPTPYSQEQLTTLMSHNVKQEQHPTNNNDDRKQSPDSVSNHNTSCNNNANVDASPNQAAATEAAFANTATSTGTARSRIASTHPNLKLSPLLSKSGQPAPEVIAAATALHQRRGATTKGKTQDDQNVGKRQKKKKTKYDAWEDSDFNDLDDASLKKLLEEAYWYRNPGDRKNKSERFLQMLKKAEYDEENSYRAIKTCLSATHNSSNNNNSSSTSTTAGNNYSSSYHRSASAAQRHKQGGSLQDLVEAAHRSELATTSAAAAAAAASVTQRFNCDYQLGGNRSNRRQQQHQQLLQQQRIRINNNNNNNHHQHHHHHHSSSSNNNSSVSARQREGGSLPSSVNLESISMDGKLKQSLGGEHASTASGHGHGKGSSSSLPTQLSEAQMSLISTQFDMDEDDTAANDQMLEESDVSKKLKLLSNANNTSMSFKTEKLFNQQMQLPESNKDSGGAAVQEFLIDDPLTFSMLEISAKNQQLQQQLQQQLMQQQQMQPQYFPAGPMNAAASGIGGQFTITMDEQRRRIDPGYVSLNDSYTACSSVYGAPSCSNANSSEAASKASSCGNSADSDLRPAKMGRMMSAAAAAAVAASHGAKATSRQFDENGNALSDASLASSSSSSGANQFQTLISNSMAAGSNSGQLQRSNGISTQLASGSTTAMAAAAVAASLNSQLQQGPMMAGALMAAHGQTKLKLKKKSQQERNTTTVDVMSVAGYRGNDPIEQLVKYIENEEKNGMQQQKKKERKQKQSKLKKCNSLEELRSCAKMEVDELKHQSATTDQMMRNSKKNGNGNSSSSNGKHNSASVADISKNCNKEQQQQQQQQQQQPAAQPATGRKSERRSWGTEELQYLGEPLSAVVKPAATAAWAECAAAELSAHPIVPMPLPLSELEALNTVLCETAEFHVVTKKKKPKKQRAVTMDDAAVAAAAHTGGNLQRMQQITKSASSNMMSQRLRGSIDYYNNGNHYAVKQPPQQQQYQQQQQHQQQQQQQHQQQSTAAQDNSRRKSTSSMPPSEKSDSSDLDSVHSLPIQTGKKKSNNKRTVAPVKHNSNTNSHNKTNSNSSPPAPISYADIARNKLEALANAGDDLDTGHNEVLPLPEAKPKLKAKQRPDFPELPGATVVIATAAAAAAAAATSSSSSSISYSQSLNATPPSSGSSDAETTPETTPSVTVTPTTATATAPTTTSTSSNTNIVTTANVATSTNSAPPPALQKSRSVEHDASGYSFNSSNLDLQYPALEKTVKRHSASNVSLPASNSALSFNFAAAARQLTDKSSLDATSSSTSSSKLSLSSASTSSGSSSSSIKSKSASKELSPSASSKKDKPVIKPSQELEEQAPPPPAPAKVTAATQTDSAKKYCSSNSGASSSANSSSSSGSMSLGSGPRPAVIILNDDRDSALGRLNNEFIFGDFNEDELKLFDDAGEKDKAKDKKQAEDKPSSVSKPSSSSDSASANSSVSASTSEQQLNDSGAASDVVNSSACLDMLMISGQAAQSSPNTANNSSTSSSASNSTSVSTSSSSSTLSNISCTETIKQLVNQSSDSGIYAQQQQQHQPSSRSNSVQNLHIKDQVNHFLRKANSTQSSCSSMDEPLPQLETCNDIEAAIIAAARAAAAAARSSSCSRSNSQEQKQEEPKVAQPKAKPKSQQASPAKLKSTRPAILMTYSNADAAEDEAELSELSFVAELKSEPPVCEPNRIPTPPPMPPNAMRQALMDNSELIVEYISSSWNAIVNSKYVTFYCEQEEQTI